jgi:hypothetical protein
MDSEQRALPPAQAEYIHPAQEPPLLASFWPRDVDVYYVFDHEFKSIKSAASNSGLYLAFAGISFGLMTALLITLLTVEIKDARIFASFVVGFGASVLATLLLGFKAYFEYTRTYDQIDSITNQSKKRGAIRQPLPSSTPYTQDLTKR